MNTTITQSWIFFTFMVSEKIVALPEVFNMPGQHWSLHKLIFFHMIQKAKSVLWIYCLVSLLLPLHFFFFTNYVQQHDSMMRKTFLTQTRRFSSEHVGQPLLRSYGSWLQHWCRMGTDVCVCVCVCIRGEAGGRVGLNKLSHMSEKHCAKWITISLDYSVRKPD